MRPWAVDRARRVLGVVIDEAPDVVGQRRRSRVLAWVVWVCVTPFAAWSLVRTGGWERGRTAVDLLPFTPYVAAASLGALALALGTRRWWAAGVAAFAVVTLGFCVLPRFVADADAARPATPGPA